jgi:tripartite-type tricarboxylate transporter receptor subunit TctC
MKESGYPELISYSWFGLSAPARTPAPIVERIAREMQVVLKLPDVVKRWEEIGAESSTMTPAEYTGFVKAELEKWSPVVKASGAKPE